MPEWSRLNRDQLTANTEFVPLPADTTFKAKDGRPLAEIKTKASGQIELRTKARIDRSRGSFMGIGHSLARNAKLAFGVAKAEREEAEHGFDKSVDTLIEDVANGPMPTVGFLRNLLQIRKAGIELQATNAAHATGVPASDDPVKRFGENLLLGLLAVRQHDPAKGRTVLIKLGLMSDGLQLRIDRLESALTAAQARDVAADNQKLRLVRTKLESLKAYVAELNTIRDALVYEEFRPAEAPDDGDAEMPEVPDVRDNGDDVDAEIPEAPDAQDNDDEVDNDQPSEVVEDVDNDAEADNAPEVIPARKGTLYEEHFEVGRIADDMDRTDALKKAIGRERAQREEAEQSSLPEHVRAFNFGLVEHKEKAEAATKSVIFGMADAARRDQRAFDKANVRTLDPMNRPRQPLYPEVDRGLNRSLREFQVSVTSGKINPQKTLQLYKDLYAYSDHWNGVKKAADDRLFEECLAIADTEADLRNSALPPEYRMADEKSRHAKAQRYMNAVLRNGSGELQLGNIRNYKGVTQHELDVVLNHGDPVQQLAALQYVTGLTIDPRFGPGHDKLIAKQAGNVNKLREIMLDMHDGVEGASEFRRLATAYEAERAAAR